MCQQPEPVLGDTHDAVRLTEATTATQQAPGHPASGYARTPFRGGNTAVAPCRASSRRARRPPHRAIGAGGSCASPSRRPSRSDRLTLIGGQPVRRARGPRAGSIAARADDPPYSSGGLHAATASARRARSTSRASTGTLQAEFVVRTLDNRDQRSFLLGPVSGCTGPGSDMRPGAILGAFTDWRQLPVDQDALQTAGLVWRGIVPWDKTEAVRPQLGRYRNQARVPSVGHERPPCASVGRIAPGAYGLRSRGRSCTWRPCPCR